MSANFFKLNFVFEGFSLSFDQVFVQGKAGTNRSVAQYYLSISEDDDVYVKVAEGDSLKVKFVNLLFMNLNCCLL